MKCATEQVTIAEVNPMMNDTHKTSTRLLRNVLIANHILEDAKKLSPAIVPDAEKELAIAFEKYTAHTLNALDQQRKEVIM